MNKKNLNNIFYNDIKGVFAIYDATKTKSLEKTLKLIENLRLKIGNDTELMFPPVLFGNKINISCL